MTNSLDSIVEGTTPVAEPGTVLLDLSAAKEDKPFEQYIVGADQPGIVVGAEVATSKAGNPMLVWEFLFTGGPNVSRKIKKYTPTSGKGAVFAKRVIDALGFDGAAGFKPSTALGKPVVLDIQVQKNDPERTEVATVKGA